MLRLRCAASVPCSQWSHLSCTCMSGTVVRNCSITFNSFSTKQDGDGDAARLHSFNIKQKQPYIHLPCNMEAGALCVLTGISSGWIWILIIHVEVWQVVPFQHLRVNTQTSCTFLTHRPSGCVYRPSQSAISSGLSRSCQAAVSYLFCLEEIQKKEAAKLKWGRPEFLPLEERDGRVWVWCLRVAGGICSKARAAAGAKSNFVLITHPCCLRQLFSNKEFDLGRYYSYANFSL